MLNNDNLLENNAVLPAEKVPEMPPQPRTYRMAILGGTFDPLHRGHTELAERVLQLGLCDEIMFIPSGNPPHKSSGFLTASEHRLAMLRLAVEANPAFSYSDIELQREDRKSYTFDTLQILSKTMPDCQLFFLMGMDCLQQLHTWHRASELVQYFNFIVYPRPGVRTPYYAELVPHFGERGTTKLLNSVLPPEGLPLWDISSSDLRQACSQGGDLSAYVSASVWSYICEHRLYQHNQHSEQEHEQ
ncbi:MAG: nicotinate-nucleotide adenylyltransferase, partial [Lentisphaeria bacterium]